MSELLSLLVGIATFLVTYRIYSLWFDRHQHHKRLPPGSHGWPLFGETLSFLTEGHQFVRVRRQRFGKVFRTHLLGRPTVVVIGPEQVRSVLLADESVLVQMSPGNFGRLLGPGALTSLSRTSDSHCRLRNAIFRAMSDRDWLRSVCGMTRSIVQAEISSWTATAKLGDGNAGASSTTPVYCVPRCRRMLLSIIYAVLLGGNSDTEEMESVVREFEQFSLAAFSLPINLPGFQLHRGLKSRKFLLQVVNKCVERARTDSVSSRPTLLLTLLDCLQADGDNELDAERIIAATKLSRSLLGDLVLELMFASYDTTSSSMFAVLRELADRDHVLTGVRQELEGNRETNGSDDGFLVTASSSTSSYVGSVVAELLRLHPPVAGAFRTTVGFMKIGEYVIPPGWSVMYSIRDTHESNSSFDNPGSFDLSHWHHSDTCSDFNDETSDCGKRDSSTQRVPNRFKYLPFGAGSRHYCVGQTLARLILTTFVVELSLEAPNGWVLVNGPPVMRTAPFPIPTDGLPIIFKKSSTDRVDPIE